ncbi:hypothetical protein LCGC14_1325350 [marine sediment metagenome]|uniref:Uncharacterized protein n=1 Tax=marine sediment metagenome TaxID=412755 RepID=A0A0F9L431_9ZZZZ
MQGFKKQYFYSLIFMNINRLDMEEKVRDFFLSITKNSMEKHQQYFPSLADVMEPSVNFFKNNDGKSCMTTIYGYERRIENLVDDLYEEGQKLWFTILDLLLGFVGTMRKSHEFELYAYGMAFDKGEFGWFLFSTGNELPAKQVYKIFPKEYIAF